MKSTTTLHNFAALSNEGRLWVLRLLLRHAPHSVPAGQIARSLGLKPNTLPVHLSVLETAPLIRAEWQGRFVCYLSDLAPETLKVAMVEPFKVLFLCSGNSARSIFAEALWRDPGGARLSACSAGTRPQSSRNSFAIAVLERGGHATTGLCSKHVAEFQGRGAPQLDFVFTVCDAAASAPCAPWPVQPDTAHGGLPEPMKTSGTYAEKLLAFAQAPAELRRRIIAFVALPVAELHDELPSPDGQGGA